MSPTRSGHIEPNRSIWVAALIGAAIMVSVDGIIFHQVLGWHHFYDRSTPAAALMSDGLLHAAALIALVAGFLLFAHLRRWQALATRHAWGGFFLGAGGFQLFDGLVIHKVLRLHQIRYEVDILSYDVAWNAVALVLIAIGVLLIPRRRSADKGSNARDATPGDGTL